MNRLAKISALQSAIDDCLRTVLPAAPYSLLDFPDHANVGDSAIWLGERRFFDRFGQKCRFVGSLARGEGENIDPRRSGTIILHGGGNFGTIWPAHQQLRVTLLERAKGTPIVQLPQSIHFKSDEDIDDTARAIEGHGAFTLLVRDQPSFELATKRFQCPVHLCPDMAFMIGAKQRLAAEVEVLALMRTDVESRNFEVSAETPDCVVVDWLDDDGRPVQAARMLGRLKGLLSGSALGGEFDAVAEQRFGRGVRLLSRGRAVITDRLHGHIMCTLLGIPHVVLDNNYGKIRNFMAAWTSDLGIVRTASSFDEAREAARQLIAG